MIAAASNKPARDGVTPAVRQSVALLTTALILTTAALAGLSWVIFASSRDAKIARDRSTRMEELRGIIVHLDEVLTMSARLKVATGEPRWEERYRRSEPQLGAAIAEVKRIAGTPAGARAVAETDAANRKLVEMENRAFALVRAGHTAEAHAVVFGPEYEREKQIYTQGVAAFISQIGRALEAVERQDKRLRLLSALGALAVLATSFVAWWSVLRGLRQWRREWRQTVGERRQAEQALQRAHAELEVRIAQRTAELEKANQALQAENTERQQAETALRASEEQFRAMFELASVGIAQADPRTGRWLRVNQKMCAIAGYSAAEMLQMRVSEITHPEDRAKDWEKFEQVVRGESPDYRMEKRYLRKDGTVAWVNVNMTVIRDAAGQPTRTLAAIEDITARKHAEEALRASLQITEGIINAIPVRVFWKDKNLVFLGCNAIFARDAGFADPKDVIGKDDYQMSSRDQAELYRRDDRQVIESGDARLLIEEPQTTPEGKIITLLTSKLPLRNSRGEIDGVLGTYIDITPRKRAEEALRESEARFSGAFEQAPIGVALVAPEGRWLKVNRALCELVGYSEAELLTRTFQDITHPPDLAAGLEQVRRIIAGEISSYQIEKHYVHARGHLITALLCVSLVRDDRGRPLYFIAQIQDITERKLAEAALEKMNRELIEASHLAGMAEVATGVLHNVGNVLNSVNVSATLVANQVRHTKAGNVAKLAALFEQHKANLAEFLTKDARGQSIPAYLASLAESIVAEQTSLIAELTHLRQNVEHIKEIVTLQQANARTRAVTETVAIPDLIEEALFINADALARHNVATIRDYQAVPAIATDKHKVLQILINLVRNAKLACVESDRPDKQITLRTMSDDRSVAIAILDNGVGIPAENLTRIFHHGFTTRKTGHGFGLHSSALAAKAMGGSLTVHSDGPGHGATFVLELPCKPDASAHENPTDE